MNRDTVQRRSRRWILTAVGIGLAWAAAACSGGAATPAAKPAPAAAPAAASAPSGAAPATAPAALFPVQYGSISKTAWEWPKLVAMQRGFLTRAGFEVDFTYFRTPANGAQLLTAGALDVAGINPETVIRSVQGGAPLVMIASDTNVAPYSLIVQPDVRGWADLKGKTLPSSGPREQTTVWMKSILKTNGLQESDYDFVVVGGTPERMAAIRSGAVAGGLVGQPQDFQMIADGYRRLALLSEYVPDHPISIHAGRTEWLQAHPDQAAALLRAVRDATRWLYDPANKTEAIALLAEEIEVPEPLARQTYEMLVEQVKAWSADLVLTPALVQKSIDFLGEIGDLTPPLPSTDKYLDRRYAEAANR